MQTKQQIDALRLAYSNYTRANLDYQQLRDQGGLSLFEQADFESWIRQLAELFLDKCRAADHQVRKLATDDVPCAPMMSAASTSANIDLTAERTEAEKTALLIEQMNGSMGQFDETLLREQDRIKAQKPRGAYSGGVDGDEMTGQTGAGEGEGKSDAGMAQASASGSNSPDGEQSADQTKEQGSTGTARTQTSSTRSDTPPNSGSGGSPGNKSGNAADDIPDGSDDDIVARQLREAAENETDPVLQKKLWEEYRRYKSGIR